MPIRIGIGDCLSRALGTCLPAAGLGYAIPVSHDICGSGWGSSIEWGCLQRTAEYNEQVSRVDCSLPDDTFLYRHGSHIFERGDALFPYALGGGADYPSHYCIAGSFHGAHYHGDYRISKGGHWYLFLSPGLDGTATGSPA